MHVQLQQVLPGPVLAWGGTRPACQHTVVVALLCGCCVIVLDWSNGYDIKNPQQKTTNRMPHQIEQKHVECDRWITKTCSHMHRGSAPRPYCTIHKGDLEVRSHPWPTVIAQAVLVCNQGKSSLAALHYLSQPVVQGVETYPCYPSSQLSTSLSRGRTSSLEDKFRSAGDCNRQAGHIHWVLIR